jgi:hypothetical protein
VRPVPWRPRSALLCVTVPDDSDHLMCVFCRDGIHHCGCWREPCDWRSCASGLRNRSQRWGVVSCCGDGNWRGGQTIACPEWRSSRHHVYCWRLQAHGWSRYGVLDSLLRPVVCVCACVLRTCASRVDFSCHSLGMWSGSTASEVWGTSQLRLLVVQAWACSRC